jgi:hypothetical protein
MTLLLVAVGLGCFTIGIFGGIIAGAVLATKTLTKMHLGEMERFGNMMTIGVPQVAEPEIVGADPDAAARVRAQIHKDRVDNGVAVLQQRYRDQGMTLSDEEAVIQVEAMLSGRSPVPE